MASGLGIVTSDWLCELRHESGGLLSVLNTRILCSEKNETEQSGEVDINFHFYGIKTEQRKIRDMG